MPGETSGAQLPSPWKDFLGEIDRALERPLEIHCIGGFALVFYYGIPRTTGDIDYYTAVPADVDLEALAGCDSALHLKYKIYLHRVTVTTLPEEYEERLSEMASGQYERLKLLVPDPYDYILSKLQRAGLKDSDDALYLFQTRKLQSRILRERYHRELRNYLIGPLKQHDETLERWIEIFESAA
ncbi:MAG: DUF6036 family nucleotidyltransferase [Candidatus Acidiferrales bacterium]